MITGIELVSRTARGRAWLLDIHTRRPGATASSPIALPQVGVVSSEVELSLRRRVAAPLDHQSQATLSISRCRCSRGR